MNTRNHRNLCKGIETVAGFTSSGQGGERFLCDWSDNRFADLQMAMLAWQTLINFKNVEKLVFRWDPDKISLQDLFCAGYMLCEMVVREQETQVFTFRHENWLQLDHTLRLKNPDTRNVRHWYLLRQSWRKRKNTFSDSRNREHHRRVGFWVQAPESDWAGGWQKYGEESCDIMLHMMAKR